MDKGLTSFTFLFMAGSFIIAVKGKAIMLDWQYTYNFQNTAAYKIMLPQEYYSACRSYTEFRVPN